MKGKPLFMLLFVLIVSSGCATSGRYLPDEVDYSGHYIKYSEPESEKVFDRYELGLSYKVKDGKLFLSVDPREAYRQDFAQYAHKNRRYSEKYYLNPDIANCFIYTIYVFGIFIANDEWRRECFGKYVWDRKIKPLGEEKVGTISDQNRHERKYRDTDGNIKFELFADGKKVNSVNLAGFKGDARSGAYTYTVNDWYDFSQLDENDSLKIKISNVRGRTYITKNLPIRKEDAEYLIFKSKYDGVFELAYLCRLCNANLTDNFYTDQQVIIWTTATYRYKGNGNLNYVASCIEKRFDHLRHGDVRLYESETPKGLNQRLQILYGGSIISRGHRRLDKPSEEDIRSCIREKRQDLVIE